jgi:hypothetical protein
MAPERFLGHADQRSDLYALGLTLYELLTMRPAFGAGDRHKLIDQVKNDEPPRPCKRDPSVPRDLETVVLKAMAKDPAHRYASADEMAEDLRRFVEDKPIRARPVGSAERLWRWCRRNPMVASLSTGLMLALLAGTAFSLAFAVEANGARKRAEETAEAESRERQQREKAEKEVLAAQEGLEQSLVQGLVRPLNPDGGDILSEPEAETLWELAKKPGDRLWWRFIDEGTRTPVTSGQFRVRAEPALIAAVGLDPEKRLRAEQLLMQKLLAEQLSEFGADFRRQLDVALAAATLGNLEPNNAWIVATLILQGLALDDGTLPRAEVTRLLLHQSGRLEARSAALILTQALEMEITLENRRMLLRELANRAGELEPNQAARTLRQVADVLVRALQESRNPVDSGELSEQLATVAGRLEPAEAAQVLIHALEKKMNFEAKQWLVKALAIAAGRMDSGEADRMLEGAASLLTRYLQGYDGQKVWWLLTQGRASIETSMEPKETRHVLKLVARVLIHAMQATDDPDLLREYSKELAIVVERLEGREAGDFLEDAVRMLTNAITAEEDPNDRLALAVGLAAVTAHMEPSGLTLLVGRAAWQLYS